MLGRQTLSLPLPCISLCLSFFSLCLCLSLSVCLHLSLSLCLPLFCMLVHRFISISVFLSFCLSRLCLPPYLSQPLFSLSVSLSLSLSPSVSLCLHLSLSVSLSFPATFFLLGVFSVVGKCCLLLPDVSVSSLPCLLALSLSALVSLVVFVFLLYLCVYHRQRTISFYFVFCRSLIPQQEMRWQIFWL